VTTVDLRGRLPWIPPHGDEKAAACRDCPGVLICRP
jgi:hypothetical protein